MLTISVHERTIGVNPESFFSGISALATIGCKSSGAGVGSLASGIAGCCVATLGADPGGGSDADRGAAAGIRLTRYAILYRLFTAY